MRCPEFALRHGLAALVIFAGHLGAGHLDATPLYLPDELPLAALPIELDLDDAEVYVTVRPDPHHLLRGRLAVRDAGDPPNPAALDVVLDTQRLLIRRLEAEAPARRLVIDLLVAAGQPLKIVGSDLDLVIEDLTPRTPIQPHEGGTAEELKPSAIRLELTSSRAQLTALHDAVVDLSQSALWTSDTDGDLAVRLQGGTAEISGHLGPTLLEANDAEVTFRESTGGLQARSTGGRLELFEGRGELRGNLTDSALIAESWLGRAEVVAEGGLIEVRSELADATEWSLQGQNVEVVLEGLRGTVKTVLDGGSLRADQIGASLTVEADAGTRVDLADLRGRVVLRARGDSQALLRDVANTLNAVVSEARLEVDGVGTFQLEASRAEVVARRVAQLAATVKATDSDLTLDLTEIRNPPFLKLQGTGSVYVQLAVPCVVRLPDPDTVLEASVTVTGCERRLPRQRVSEHLKYGAGAPIRLTVRLDPDVELEVEGVP